MIELSSESARTGSTTMLLFFLAFLFLGGAVIAFVNPGSQVWWGRSDRPRPQWQISQMNIWMFDDSDGRDPSPAGAAAIRIAGMIMLIASIVLTIKGFQQLT